MVIMAKKKADQFDHIRYLAYASIFSIAQRKQSIDADEMFLGIFMYTKEKKFFELFRKFLGLHDTTHIQKYITDVYTIPNDSWGTTLTQNLSLNTHLTQGMQMLEQHHDAKNNFLV